MSHRPWPDDMKEESEPASLIVDDLMAVDNHSLTADELNADVIELCRGIDRLNVVADKLSVLDELTHIDLAVEQRRTSG